MLMPPAFEETDAVVVLDVVRGVGFGHLVIVDADGSIESTPVPFLVDDSLSTVLAHVGRRNPIAVDGASALLIVAGADGYVSPSWYPTKAETGKVVPTWDYEVVHVRGRLGVHADPSWLRDQVTALTDHHEAARDDPWAVTDAPADFIESQLRGIVGLSLHVDSIAAKRKLSQNRPAPDQAGVLAGLERSTAPRDAAVARAMARTRPRSN
ncbi:MAG: FMN-binding negative transcriptional regulator [Actinomycetota bacterium]